MIEEGFCARSAMMDPGCHTGGRKIKVPIRAARRGGQFDKSDGLSCHGLVCGDMCKRSHGVTVGFGRQRIDDGLFSGFQ